ncbi:MULTISPECIES: hypothetical protein [Streptomyces]|uniref:Uncharacterized protein n=2 Tax=Streptomyces TaxID=1883 RepID=A0A2N8P8F3_STRNR|nr:MULTISPECIES: hypothetical protein [Streptomyces]PNE37303.1 hypothetical protein AOB60_23430 [Streptomyces noursei]SHM25648.1 hypothetical protein SAMN05216268_109273 [Streptomyces yunnanensis]
MSNTPSDSGKQALAHLNTVLHTEAGDDEEFLVTVGGVAAVLCAFIYMGSMTYTFAHQRSWDGMVALVVSVIFALVALLSAVPLVMARGTGRSPVMPRALMWGTGLVLAVLQLTAAVLGDARFSMSTVIGITTALAVPCFGELAGRGARSVA